MPRKKKPQKYLSASRIGTLDKCSWLYWVKYHLRVPDTPNEGMLRGSICHLVFELLLKAKHKERYDSILEGKSIKACTSINRMVKSFMAKHPTFNKDNWKENYELIDKMILLGLNYDFFGEEKGGVVDKPEEKFEITSKNPKYKILGFMDKPVTYPKDKSVTIVDYKSSKNKFRGEELSCNIQAMMYSLAAKKIWPKLKKRVVEFLFLKFPRSPSQRLEYTDEQLKGFEHYLARVQRVIENFDIEAAKTNFAANNNYRWLCGPAKSGWVCPVKKPFDFYVLLDEEGEVVSSSFEDNFDPKEGQAVEKRSYEGCPHFNVIAATSYDEESKDLLDF